MEKIARKSTRVTDVTQPFYDLVIHFECSGDVSKYLKPYIDGGGVPTIGIGTTFYPDGRRVSMKDKAISVEKSYEYFHHEVGNVIKKVDAGTRDDITIGMLNGLVDFGYNTGKCSSTSLHKVINTNPYDPNIKWYWYQWRFDNGVYVPGLLRRRMCEFYLYQNGFNHPDFFQSEFKLSEKDILKGLKSFFK